MKTQYLLNQGSEVNGLEQPFHPRRLYCLIQYAPSDVGGDYR